jgi:rhamnosyl/mannosyltransferase
MNIVELGKYFPPQYLGGIEVITELSARALANDHNVTVICHNTGCRRSQEVRDGYRVVRAGTQLKRYSQPVSLFMGLELRKAKPDLIHFHAPNFWGALMITLFCPTVPLIITHHADVEGRAFLKRCLLPLYHRLVRRAGAVIVSSLKNAKISTDLPRDVEKVIALPLGVSESSYVLDATAISQLSERKRIEFGDNDVVGFIGRFVWYKGLNILLQAVCGFQDLSLLLIGDGPLKKEIQREASVLNISDRVHFVGTVSHAEKLRYLHMMDIFVLPSTHITEAFGISQVEAMICSRPIISTNLPTGVSDVNADGITGLVVPPSDVDALASAIDRLLRDKALRRSYGINGRERARALFSERNYIEKLRASVASVLTTNVRGSPQLDTNEGSC